MRAWLLVLAVLATFHKVTEVASTEQVSSSSSSSQHRSTEHLTDSYSSSSSSSSTLDRSRRNTFIIDSSSSRSSSRNSDNNNSNNVNNINSHNNNSNDNRISEHITTTTTITTSDLREHHQSSSEKNEKENSVYNNNNNLNSKENEILNRNYNDDYDTNGQDDDDDINEVDYYEQYEDEEDQEKDQRRRPSPEQLVEIEKNLLSLFGFSKRPKIDRSKIVIPEAMRKLYQQITGHDLDAELNLPKRSSGAAGDLHLKNSNTVRSFTHEGELSSFFIINFFPYDSNLDCLETALLCPLCRPLSVLTNFQSEIRQKWLVHTQSQRLMSVSYTKKTDSTSLCATVARSVSRLVLYIYVCSVSVAWSHRDESLISICNKDITVSKEIPNFHHNLIRNALKSLPLYQIKIKQMKISYRVT